VHHAQTLLEDSERLSFLLFPNIEAARGPLRVINKPKAPGQGFPD